VDVVVGSEAPDGPELIDEGDDIGGGVGVDVDVDVVVVVEVGGVD